MTQCEYRNEELLGGVMGVGEIKERGGAGPKYQLTEAMLTIEQKKVGRKCL
jgi:hypothetical protein